MNYAMCVGHGILCALLSQSVGLSWMSLPMWDYMALCWLLPFLASSDLGLIGFRCIFSVLLYVSLYCLRNLVLMLWCLIEGVSGVGSSLAIPECFKEYSYVGRFDV